MPDDAQRRVTVSSSGCAPLAIGLVVGGVGLALTIALLRHPGSVTVNHRRGERRDAWMPAIAVVIGVAIAGIRQRRVVDLDARTIESRSGWGPFVRTTIDDLGEWRSIELGHATSRGSGSGRYTAVPVSVVGATATREIAAPREPAKARALAVRIADGAGIALRDASGDAVVERPAGRLAEPLVARLRAGDLAAIAPADNRLRIDEGIHGVRVRVPARPFAALLPHLVPAGMFFAFWWFLWRPHLGTMNDPIARVMLNAPLLFTAVPLLVGAAQGRRSGAFGAVIEADDADGLRALGRRIPRDDLIGLDVVSVGGRSALRATTATDELVFAIGCSRDELAWLRAVLLRALRG